MLVKMVAQGGVQAINGKFTRPSSGTVSVYCGFRPKRIAMWYNGSSGTPSVSLQGSTRIIYDESFISNKCCLDYVNGNGQSTVNMSDLTNLFTITDDGFEVNASTTSIYNGEYNFFATS